MRPPLACRMRHPDLTGAYLGHAPFSATSAMQSHFYTLKVTQIVIESWRRHYNAVRPHASLGYRPPAPEVFVPTFTAWPAALARPAASTKLPMVERPDPDPANWSALSASFSAS